MRVADTVSCPIKRMASAGTTCQRNMEIPDESVENAGSVDSYRLPRLNGSVETYFTIRQMQCGGRVGRISGAQRAGSVGAGDQGAVEDGLQAAR